MVRDTSHLFFGEELSDLLKKGDVNIVNFEAPVFVKGAKGIFKSGPHLSQDKDGPLYLQEHGFNVVSLANNHAIDYGENSAITTIKSFDKAITLGCGKWDEAFKVKIINVNDTKIGFLALTQSEFGAFSDRFYDSDYVGTASLMNPEVDELILESSKEVDYLFVLPHAGMEHCPQPLPQLVTLYRHFINMGASGVIGGHPHIPQPWEIYKNCPIVYSLGNFCFDEIYSNRMIPDYWDRGMIVSLIISDNKTELEIHKAHYEIQSKRVNLCDNDEDFDRFLKDICNIFKDKAKYGNVIDEHIKKMAESYGSGFSENGYFRFSVLKYVRVLISHFYRKIPGMQKRQNNSSHLLNFFQCEAHRWAIWHLLKNKSL